MIILYGVDQFFNLRVWKSLEVCSYNLCRTVEITFFIGDSVNSGIIPVYIFIKETTEE